LSTILFQCFLFLNYFLHNITKMCNFLSRFCTFCTNHALKSEYIHLNILQIYATSKTFSSLLYYIPFIFAVVLTNQKILTTLIFCFIFYCFFLNPCIIGLFLKAFYKNLSLAIKISCAFLRFLPDFAQLLPKITVHELFFIK